MGPLAFLHGAASGLLLLVGCLLWRDRRAILAGRLGTAVPARLGGMEPRPSAAVDKDRRGPHHRPP